MRDVNLSKKGGWSPFHNARLGSCKSCSNVYPRFYSQILLLFLSVVSIILDDSHIINDAISSVNTGVSM